MRQLPAAPRPLVSTPSRAGDARWVYEARDLRKEFDEGQIQALRGVDFQIAEGEFVAINGPSGCGKTTLLQMLGALDQPSAGMLLYRGRALSDYSDTANYRAREIGFVFQAFHLLPTFTAIENVQIPMFETGRPPAERTARARALLESVGLAGRINHFPAKLSGGERQRVAIARSLANEPSVLLADEPTGNLDSENARQVLELLMQLHRDRHMTLVLVTHDPGISATAPRAITLRDGRVVQDTQRGAPPATPP